MKKTLLLALSYTHKRKGQITVFVIITIISILLMNLGFITALHYDKNFENQASKLNNADSAITLQTTDTTIIDDIITNMQADQDVKSIDNRSVLLAGGEFSYNNQTQSRYAVVLNKSDISVLNQIEIIQESTDTIDHPIYLPYLFQTGGAYMIGDSFTITLSSNTESKLFTFTVAGFYEETFLATINSSLVGFILEEDDYQFISKEFNGSIDGTYILASLQNSITPEAFTTKYLAYVNTKISSDVVSDSTFFQLIKQARTTTSSIGSLVVVAFSFIIMLVALIVIRFHINHTIEEEIQNLGVLKAMGYTSSQIITSLLLQFIIITGIGTILGIGLAYVCLPFLSSVFAAQTGIVWKQGFDIISSSISVLIMFGAVTFTSLLASIRVKKLHPIIAIRGGITTHNFKRNTLALDKARGDVNVLLALKNSLQSIKSNRIMVIVIIIIGFLTSFASVLYYNTAIEEEYFFQIFSGEFSDIQVQVIDVENADEALTDIKNSSGIEKAFFYNMEFVMHQSDGSELLVYITDDFSQIKYQETLYQGRFPLYDNEIALGALIAESLNKKVGETITIEKDGNSYEYLICGLIQGANYLGHDACLTTQGYYKISPDFMPSTINIYLKPNENATDKIKELENALDDTILKITDVYSLLKGTNLIFQNVIKLLVTIIAIITIIIVNLILYLIIKTSILHRRKELGILKALGYTNTQLIIQMAITILPLLIIGVLLGTIIGYFGVNPLLSIIFSSIGIMKANFVISKILLMLVGVSIISIGFIMSIVVSIRIRLISPYALMQE